MIGREVGIVLGKNESVKGHVRVGESLSLSSIIPTRGRNAKLMGGQLIF